jgi:hypothetical protein
MTTPIKKNDRRNSSSGESTTQVWYLMIGSDDLKEPSAPGESQDKSTRYNKDQKTIAGVCEGHHLGERGGALMSEQKEIHPLNQEPEEPEGEETGASLLDTRCYSVGRGR